MKKFLLKSIATMFIMMSLTPNAFALKATKLLEGDFQIQLNPTTVKTDLSIQNIDVGDEYNYIYTKICATKVSGLDTIDFKMTIGSQSVTKTADAPTTDDGCTTYFTNIDNFTLTNGTTYTVTVELDPEDLIDESDESNNSSSTTFSIPITVVPIDPDTLPEILDNDDDSLDLYVDDIGIDSTFPSAFYTDICIEGMTIDDAVLDITANGIHNTLELNGLPDNDCKRFYSWGQSYFGLDAGDSTTVTAKIDYYDDYNEDDETNNSVSETITIPADDIDDDDTDTTVIKPDLYISEAGITDDYTQLYAKVCAINDLSKTASTIDVSFTIGSKTVTQPVTMSSVLTCKETTLDIAGNFSLTDDTVYELTVKTDPSNEIAESDETNNSFKTEFSIPGTDKNVYITSVGMESDYTNFYATVCGDNTSGTELIKLNFNAAGYDNTLGITTPSDGNCKTFYSWGMNMFDPNEDTTYTLTVTVDYYDAIVETDENNTYTMSFSIPSEPEEEVDDLMLRPSVLFVKIGDLNGRDANDTIMLYNGLFETNNPDLLQVEFIAPVLFEDLEGHSDSYTETANGVTWVSDIYKHWDGLLFYVYPTDTTDTTTARGITLGVTGLEDITIDSESDLKTYDLNDSTDNAVSVQLLGYLDDYSGTDTTEFNIDQLKENLGTLSGLFAPYADMMENDDATSEELTSNFDDLIGKILDPNIFISEKSTEETEANITDFLNTNAADLNIADIETAIVSQETYVDVTLPTTLYDEGINPFKDVSYVGNTWYAKFVDAITSKGIVSGYKNADGTLTGEFKPGNSVTVAEMIKIAMKMAGQDESDPDTELDSAQGHWAAGWITTGEKLNLTILQDANLDLNRSATRGEVIEIIFETLGITAPEYDESSFTDGKLAGRFINDVDYAYDIGIISGYPNGTFGYNSSINRAEVSKIIVKTIETLL